MPRCMQPFSKKDGTGPFPCGKCPNCKATRASGWSFRLMQEEKISSSAWFITLTYATTHVHITKNGFMGLSKDDLQKFFKRLRVNHQRSGYSNLQLKYYAVGEYGGRTNRPHYHIILFNANVELIQRAWTDEKGMIGTIYYGSVTGASVGYTLKYISKPGKIPMHRNDDRQKEFSLMSKGLGLNYLTPQMCRWHKADIENRMYCNIEGGKKITMPRYYKMKLYTSEEKGYLKGVMEMKNKARDIELLRKGKVLSERDTRERVKAAFRKMNYRSQLKQTI